ncbi:MAG: hypothetical protein GY820_10540 [Gammaproteobacteria bacterium]|nr:hypothetical protein [Gammaproteobacteria bacterium]
MAGPRIFVPGPSVNANIGSPAQYIEGLQRAVNSNRANQLAKEEAANTKILQDAQLANQTRRLDFDLAAPERREADRVAKRARKIKRAQTIADVAYGANLTGADRLTGIKSILMQNPNWASKSDSDRLEYLNKWTLEHPEALTDYRVFEKYFKKGLLSTGQFTGPEIRDAAGDQQKRWLTGDKELIKAQLLRPKDLYFPSGNNINLSVNSNGGVSRSSGSESTKLLSDQVDQPSKYKMVDAEMSALGITKKRTGSTFGITHDDEGLPFGKKNVTRQNYDKAVASLERGTEKMKGVNYPSAIAALRTVIDGNGETHFNFDNLEGDDLKALLRIAAENEKQQTQVISKGGNISPAGQSPTGQSASGSVFSNPSQALAATAKYNEALLSQLSPRSFTDDEIVKSILSGLGPAKGGAQKPMGGLGETAPGRTRQDVTGPETGGPAAGNSAVEQILSQAGGPDVTGGPTLPAPTALDAPVQQDIGGPVAADERIRNLVSTLRDVAGKTPIGLAARGARGIGEFLGNLDLTLPESQISLAGVAPEQAPEEVQVVEDAVPAKGESNAVHPLMELLNKEAPDDLRGMSSDTRDKALTAAKALLARGLISYDDAPRGGTLNDKLLIAYRRYLQKNK